jgi:hypothetical protein
VKTIEIWDDLDARGDLKVPAVRTSVLSLDGEAAEIDLSAEHYQELKDLVAPWLAAGRRPEKEPPAAVPVSRRPPNSGSRERREFWASCRAWCDKLGLINKDDLRHPAYETTTGKSYFPVRIERGFTLHQQGREEEALVEVAPYLPEVKEQAS